MKKSIRVEIGNSPLTNSLVQDAIDAVAAQGGGVVEVPAGEYVMHDALHLRDGVELVGEVGTVLRKAASVRSPLAHILGYGHREFVVRETEKFKPGMGVYFSDQNSFGFYTTVATITAQKDELFFINRPLSHDYNPSRGGYVASLFSVIEIADTHDVAVRNITLDGNAAENETLNGCRGGGVFMLNAHQVVLENVEVTNYNGDGVSFQQCTDVFVRNCHIHDNNGGGVHPGSGSVRYVISNNRIERNGNCGIFYCLRTTHSLCENNIITDNRTTGISIGERDTDHVVRGNIITGHGAAGIEMREPAIQSGDRVWIEGNKIENNCKGDVPEPAEHELVIRHHLRNVAIIDNEINPSIGKAFFVAPGCSEISFAGNTVSGREQSTKDIDGEIQPVSFSKPSNFPAIGPEAAAPDAALHLGITELPSWKEL